MLTKKIQEALNQQVNEEAYASNYYLAMASWCDKNGLRGSASFLYAHSEAERQHMMKLFLYINAAGGHAVLNQHKQPPVQFKSLSQIFDLVFEHEKHVTESINKLVETCLKEKDYSSFNFLQWYVSEQHEEERLFTTILDMIRITGVEGRGLFMIDSEIGKMTPASGK